MNILPRNIFQRAVLLTLALLMCSCATDPSYTETEKRLLNKGALGGTVIGSMAGGILGAGIGALTGNSSIIAKSTAIGLAAGGGAGFVVGREAAREKIRQMRQYNSELREYISKLRRSDEEKEKKAKSFAADVKKKIAAIKKIEISMSMKCEEMPSATASDRSLKTSLAYEVSRLRANKELLEHLYAVQFSPPSDTGDQKEGSRGGRRSLDDKGTRTESDSSEGSIGGRRIQKGV